MQVVKVFTQYSKLDRPFTYYYYGDDIVEGIRVFCSFNTRKIVGYVTEVRTTNESLFEEEKRLGFKLSVVEEIIDKTPLLTEELLALSKVVTSYYFASHISVLNAMLPPSLKPDISFESKPKISKKREVRVVSDFVDFNSLEMKYQRYLNKVMSNGSLAYSTKDKEKIMYLQQINAVFVVEKEKYRLQYKEHATNKIKKPTKDQLKAVESILNDEKETFLLHGVTGSGKTEVYLLLAQHYLDTNKKILILVPEIALTGMMLASFYGRFGKRIAILHSELTAGEKYDEYRRIKNGEVDIVVGARSAIFAPLENIGLIIIDEEHSATYKQDSEPFYHALAVAQMRAKYTNAKIVIGSATPSIESMARAQKKVYGYYFLPKRINNQPLPETSIINMLDSTNIDHQKPFISLPLQRAIANTISKSEQIIFLINRRGYSTYVSCRSCGEVKRCPTCGISLTYHKDIDAMVCHYCGTNYDVNDRCAYCGFEKMSFKGFATQKAEEEIKLLYPQARVLRLDSDVRSKTSSPQKVVDAFSNHEVDILIGTQMVSKGHNFPLVSLVAVTGTDSSLAYPSFRSAESTFQLITQAVGRSGRNEIIGKALIQTDNPNNYVIRFAQKQDYHGFYDYELRQRFLTKNPPFYYLLSITLSHTNKDVVSDTIRILKYNLGSALSNDVLVLGPVNTFRPETGKKFDFTLTIKYKNYFKIKPKILELIAPLRQDSSLYVQINVDPFDI